MLSSRTVPLSVPLLLTLGACGGDDKADDTAALAEPVAVSGLSAEVSEAVTTMIQVTWTQDDPAESWIEFELDGAWLSSPPIDRASGEHREWILGAPAETALAWRVVTDNRGARFVSDEQSATTGALPEDMRSPEVTAWEPGLASPDGWLLGSVDVDGGGSYSGPFWLFIADRQGRVVWYLDLEYWQSMFPRVARDGTHIAYDRQYLLDPEGTLSGVVRRTLDGDWEEETLTPGLGWCWDETDDGALLYDQNKGSDDIVSIQAIASDGARSTVWDCTAWQAAQGDDDPEHCYSNTINWVPETDGILWSTYWGDYALEVDRPTGEVRWHAGQLGGGWSFDPPDAVFDLQHYPNYTPAGTLLISTHVPGVEDTQRAREYEVDYATETLRQVWAYGEGVDQWAQYSGEAVRLEGGNTLVNYGTGGEVREVTAAGELAWSLQFGDEHTLGHTQLIGDLYALNQGR